MAKIVSARFETYLPHNIPSDRFVMIALSDGSEAMADLANDEPGEIEAMLSAWLATGKTIQTHSLEALAAYAADRRWRNETGGVVIAGIPVATDDRAKLMITGARVAAMADPNWSTEWHGTDGNTYPVDAAAMVMISNAVQEHVNAGFATFALVKAAIDAGTITTTDQIDAAFGG